MDGKKEKPTYTFASSLVAYVTLTTAVSVSVLTGGKVREGVLQQGKRCHHHSGKPWSGDAGGDGGRVMPALLCLQGEPF